MPREVLLVDDSHSARIRLHAAFEASGFKVSEAGSGSEGFDFIKSYTGKIDFIVTDQNMPGLTGLEMMKEVRAMATSEKSSIPFILLTSDMDPDLVHKANALHVKAVINKPAKPDDLVKAVAKLLTA